jgi:hypothetical protein
MTGHVDDPQGFYGGFALGRLMKHSSLTWYAAPIVVFALVIALGVAHAPSVFLLKHGAVSVHIRSIERKDNKYWRISYRANSRDTVGTFASEAPIWNQKQLSLIDVPGFPYPVLIIDQVGGARVESHDPLFISYHPSDRTLSEMQKYYYAKAANVPTDARPLSCLTAQGGSKAIFQYLFDQGGQQSGPAMKRYYTIHFSGGSNGIVEVDDPAKAHPTVLNSVSLRSYAVSSGQTPLTTCAK